MSLTLQILIAIFPIAAAWFFPDDVKMQEAVLYIAMFIVGKLLQQPKWLAKRLELRKAWKGVK